MSSDRSGAGDGDEEVRRRTDREDRVDGRQRARPVSLVRSMSVNVDSGLAGEIFDHFCNAATLKSILNHSGLVKTKWLISKLTLVSSRYLCEVLRLKPNRLLIFYQK